MAFHALDFLVAVEPTLTLLRAGDDALRIHDPGRRLRRAAVGSSYPSRQLGGGIRPHAVGPEPVVPRAHRLPCPEVDRQRPPRAARMLQVETGVDHLAQIGGEGEVVLEQGLDDIPFRVRQVARIASPISLVFFSVLVCPHPNLLLAAFNSQQGKSVKQALRDASHCGRNAWQKSSTSQKTSTIRSNIIASVAERWPLTSKSLS